MNKMSHIQGALKTLCAWIGRYEERMGRKAGRSRSQEVSEPWTARFIQEEDILLQSCDLIEMKKRRRRARWEVLQISGERDRSTIRDLVPAWNLPSRTRERGGECKRPVPQSL